MKWQVVGITNADYFYLKRPGYLVTCKCYCFSEKRSEDFTDFFFLSYLFYSLYFVQKKKPFKDNKKYHNQWLGLSFADVT